MYLHHLLLQFTALTSSPAVQVAAHPWHPDLEQRSLCEPLLFEGRVNGESHEAGEEVGEKKAEEKLRGSASLNSTFWRSADWS